MIEISYRPMDLPGVVWHAEFIPPIEIHSLPSGTVNRLTGQSTYEAEDFWNFLEWVSGTAANAQ